AATGLAGERENLTLLETQAHAVDGARDGRLLPDEAGSKAEPSREGHVEVPHLQERPRLRRRGRILDGIVHPWPSAGRSSSAWSSVRAAARRDARAASRRSQAARRPGGTSAGGGVARGQRPA